MSREEHRAGVEAAKTQIGELQEILAVATERLEAASAATAAATGGMDCGVESGRNAFEFVASIDERICDAYVLAERAVAELDRYAGGF